MEYLERFILMRILIAAGFDQAIAKEISEKIDTKDMKAILSEYENFKGISEKTVEKLKAKFLTKNISELIFGVESNIDVFSKITTSLVGSGRHGLEGLRDHLEKLGFPDTKFEEILLAFYREAKGLSVKDEKSKRLLAIVCLELGSFYINKFDKKSEKFLNEAFELREEINSERVKSLAENFIKLADILEKKEKHLRAEKAIEKSFILAKDLFESLKLSDADYATMLIDMGKHYVKKDPKRAVAFFESALKFENAIPDKLLELYENIAQCYRAMKNHEKAHEYELRKNQAQTENLETL